MATNSGSDWLTSEDTKKQFITLYSTGDSVGLYGWRRRCLFCVVTLLTFVVILNLALTLWIIKVLQISSDGLGALQVHPRGVILNGNALVLDNLTISKVQTEYNHGIQINGGGNISLTSKSSEAVDVENSLRIDGDVLDMSVASFRIQRDDGHVLFLGDHKELVSGLESLQVNSQGTAGLQESLQTSTIKTNPGEPLRLEAVSSFVKVHGGTGMNLTSLAGEICVTTLNDLTLQSKSGAIILEAGAIELPKVETTNPITAKVPKAGGSLQATFGTQIPKSQAIVYQLCSCENGLIFWHSQTEIVVSQPKYAIENRLHIYQVAIKLISTL